MGISIFSFSSYDTSNKLINNPNPFNFRITKFKQIGKFLIVSVHYPDCTNYEGNKILLYEGVSLSDLKSQKSIDPHFSENKNFLSPIARFIPTEMGWSMAVALANML